MKLYTVNFAVKLLNGPALFTNVSTQEYLTCSFAITNNKS